MLYIIKAIQTDFVARMKKREIKITRIYDILGFKFKGITKTIVITDSFMSFLHFYCNGEVYISNTLAEMPIKEHVKVLSLTYVLTSFKGYELNVPNCKLPIHVEICSRGLERHFKKTPDWIYIANK